MAGLEEKLCPVCFQEAMEHGECRNCGYHAEESSAVKDYLAPFTILKEKYLLGKSLGQGGFGITYLAENMQSGLRCCIKEYFPSGLLQGRTPDGALILADEENRPEYEEGKQQFIEEACALQELRENISVVDILDFFEENGTAYFAMELIEGCNLRVFRKNHNPKQTLKMALQMLFLLGSSLAEVHRFGMIHGDISPENILITQDGEIKLKVTSDRLLLVNSDLSVEECEGVSYFWNYRVANCATITQELENMIAKQIESAGNAALSID